MRTRLALLASVVLLLSFTRPACGQEPTPMLDSLQARQVAHWVSTATMATAVSLDVIDAWRSDDKSHAFINVACRHGVAQGIVQLVKLTVPRWRPDHSDQKSFFSGHTATAAASGDWLGGREQGWNFAASVTLTDATAMGRMLAGKHHPSDVAIGALDGMFSSWLCGKVAPVRDREP